MELLTWCTLRAAGEAAGSSLIEVLHQTLLPVLHCPTKVLHTRKNSEYSAQNIKRNTSPTSSLYFKNFNSFLLGLGFF